MPRCTRIQPVHLLEHSSALAPHELYVPDEGDIIWLSFTPQSGHEQAGRRPAVVLSPKAYNQRSGLLVCVPITNQIKGYPFEVLLSGNGATGAALADQVESLDWNARQAERKGQATPTELAEIKAKIKALLKLACGGLWLDRLHALGASRM